MGCSQHGQDALPMLVLDFDREFNLEANLQATLLLVRHRLQMVQGVGNQLASHALGHSFTGDHQAGLRAHVLPWDHLHRAAIKGADLEARRVHSLHEGALAGVNQVVPIQVKIRLRVALRKLDHQVRPFCPEGLVTQGGEAQRSLLVESRLDLDSEGLENMLIGSVCGATCKHFAPFVVQFLESPVVEFKQRAANSQLDVGCPHLTFHLSNLLFQHVCLLYLVEPRIGRAEESGKHFVGISRVGEANKLVVTFCNAFAHSLFAELVVRLTVSGVAEDLVGLGDLGELKLAFGLPACFVSERVVLE